MGTFAVWAGINPHPSVDMIQKEKEQEKRPVGECPHGVNMALPLTDLESKTYMWW